MKPALALMIALACMSGRATAQGIELGPDMVSPVEIPLENRPSLGLFVQGYINGRGPYRFGLDFSGPTRLTQDVIRSVSADPPIRSAQEQIEQQGHVPSNGHFQLKLGSKAFELQDVETISPTSLDAYEPVPNYGGTIGGEIVQNGAVRIDASHSKLSFLGMDRPSLRGNVLELMLSKNDPESAATPWPTIHSVMEGRSIDIGFNFLAQGVEFFPQSTYGQITLRKSTDVTYEDVWSEEGVLNYKSGYSSHINLGGYTLQDCRVFDSYASFALRPRRGVRPRPLLAKLPSDQGVVGACLTRRFDVTIDNADSLLWLEPRVTAGENVDNQQFNQDVPKIGIVPWIFRGKGIVKALVKGSQAEAVGIKPGDEIVSINDGDVYKYYSDLNTSRSANETMKVVFRNASGEHTVMLTPAAPKV